MSDSNGFLGFVKNEVTGFYEECVDTFKNGNSKDVGMMIGILGIICFVLLVWVGLLILLGLGIVIAAAFAMQLLGITFGQLVGTMLAFGGVLFFLLIAGLMIKGCYFDNHFIE